MLVVRRHHRRRRVGRLLSRCLSVWILSGLLFATELEPPSCWWFCRWFSNPPKTSGTLPKDNRVHFESHPCPGWIVRVRCGSVSTRVRSLESHWRITILTFNRFRSATKPAHNSKIVAFALRLIPTLKGASECALASSTRKVQSPGTQLTVTICTFNRFKKCHRIIGIMSRIITSASKVIPPLSGVRVRPLASSIRECRV